jgi:hypothetical protein
MSKRATTKPAAKGRPKSSYAIGKPRKEEEPESMLLWIPDETFCEEMSEWWDSPEGQLWMEMSITLEELLKDVGLDAGQRKFLWPDANRLDLNQSVRRINQQYPDFPEDKIEEFLIDWIQTGMYRKATRSRRWTNLRGSPSNGLKTSTSGRTSHSRDIISKAKNRAIADMPTSPQMKSWSAIRSHL